MTKGESLFYSYDVPDLGYLNVHRKSDEKVRRKKYDLRDVITSSCVKLTVYNCNNLVTNTNLHLQIISKSVSVVPADSGKLFYTMQDAI